MYEWWQHCEVTLVKSNNVFLFFRCIIENCIICEESVIEDGCNIKDCLVGSHHVVQTASKSTRFFKKLFFVIETIITGQDDAICHEKKFKDFFFPY